MRLDIPKTTLERLRADQRERNVRDDVTESHSAFLLDPGLGPATYLTMDGRILIDGRYWDQTTVREATDDEAVAAIVSGARKTGIDELLSLLPPSPRNSQPCPICSGARWMQAGRDVETGEPGHIICLSCRGRGWIAKPA